MGKGKFSYTWINGEIVVAQSLINTIVVSIILNENANLGLLEEGLLGLIEVLNPICNEISNISENKR